jgi:hypothetical protein
MMGSGMEPPDSSVIGHTHHVADILISTTMVSQELGFKLPVAYVECHGWTIHRMNGKLPSNTKSCKKYLPSLLQADELLF